MRSVLGVLACLCGSWPCAIAAIALGIAAIRQSYSRSARILSNVGTALGGCGILTFVVWFVFLMVVLAASRSSSTTNDYSASVSSDTFATPLNSRTTTSLTSRTTTSLTSRTTTTRRLTTRRQRYSLLVQRQGKHSRFILLFIQFIAFKSQH